VLRRENYRNAGKPGSAWKKEDLPGFRWRSARGLPGKARTGYGVGVPTINISVTTEAYSRLKKAKIGNESFSDVIVRELPESADTCGEVLNSLESNPPPPANPKLMKMVRAGRGRRSTRPVRHAR